MPKPKKGPRLGGSPAHQRLILSNLATALFEHGRITTTESRARTLRPYAEKLITKAKKGDLHNRREVLKTIRDKGVVHVLFTEIAPTMAERPGGYTRITKLGPRKGDNAPMAVIELVTDAYTPTAPRTQAAPAAAAAPVEAEPVEVEAPEAEVEAVEVEAVEEAPAEDVAVDDAPVAEAPAPAAEETATEEAPVELSDEASPEGSVIAEEQAEAAAADEAPAEADTTEDDTKA